MNVVEWVTRSFSTSTSQSSQPGYEAGRFLFLNSVWSQTVQRCAASLVSVTERLTDGTVDDALGTSGVHQPGPFDLFRRINRIKIFLCQ